MGPRWKILDVLLREQNLERHSLQQNCPQVRRRLVHICLRLDRRHRLQSEDRVQAGQEGQAADLGQYQWYLVWLVCLEFFLHLWFCRARYQEQQAVAVCFFGHIGEWRDFQPKCFSASLICSLFLWQSPWRKKECTFSFFITIRTIQDCLHPHVWLLILNYSYYFYKSSMHQFFSFKWFSKSYNYCRPHPHGRGLLLMSTRSLTTRPRVTHPIS